MCASSFQLFAVLTLVQIQDEWVVRVLINSNQIEKTVLATTRTEAEDILRSHSRHHVWTANGLRVQRFPYVVSARSSILVNMFDRDGGGSTTSLG